MKISKLYSNNPKFKKLLFTDGLNIILGGTFDKAYAEEMIKQHDVGKSLVLELIDFCLSGSVKPTSSLQKIQEELKEYIFFLELSINNDEFLTLARTFMNQEDMYYKITDIKTDFSSLETFHKLNKKELNNYLTKYINGDSGEDFNFRSTIKRFYRTTDKYIDSFNKDDIYSKADLNWLPDTLNSYGFGYSDAYDYISSFSKLDILKKNLTKAKEWYGFSRKTSRNMIEKKLKEIKENLNKKKQELLELTKKVNNFNLYKISDEQIHTLVKELDFNISKLNNKKYFLIKRIAIFNQSKEIKTNEVFHNKIKEVFKEAGIIFTDQLVKSYDDLTAFNKQITLERDTLLDQQITEFSTQLEMVNSELMQLEHKKEELLEKIISTDSDKKYLAAKKELEAKNNELIDESVDGKNVNLLYEMLIEEKQLKTKVKKYAKKYEKLYNDQGSIILECNKTLKSASAEILKKEVSINLGLTKKSKPEISITNLGEKDKAGETVSTVKSVIYDVSLLKSYDENKSIDMPKYLIHDSPLANLGQYDVKAFEFLINSFKNSDKQYIFTAFKEQISKDEIEQAINELMLANNINIVASLYIYDNDYSNTLFGKKI